MTPEVLDSIVSAAAAKGDQLQIKLNEVTPNPIGPGDVCFYVTADGTKLPGVYRIITAAMMQTPQGPVELKLPIIFTADSVLWVAEPPLNQRSEPLIEFPGQRSRGGLHIG